MRPHILLAVASLIASVIVIEPWQPAQAATIRVPRDHKTIQAAIDAAGSGDTVLVGAGVYRERIRLKPGLIVRSEGDDARGTDGLKRAESTILDGGGEGGETAKRPGVEMASDSTLDGFTVTRVGQYDEAVWMKHHDSQGEELGDDEGSVQAEGTIPAISIRGVNCRVVRCVAHHNGDVGMGVIGTHETTIAPVIAENVVFRNMGGGIGVAEGAEPVVRGNICKENLRAGIGCRKANPFITGNDCFQNVRAGIGCREGARPVIRANRCRGNRRAGIGIRMEATAPVVEGNECAENDMAGIGCRDRASPIVRNNLCRRNKLAGIGCADGAKPLIVGNECLENERAGIGLRDKADAVIQDNRCVDNRLVAIGVTGESRATILGNTLSRADGVPPIIAVKDGSTATIQDNRITGGGVAAILVQGKVAIAGNTFVAAGAKPGNAVWIHENATAGIADNSFDGYRSAVQATKATVSVTGNTVERFQTAAIVIRDSRKPAHVHGNRATSSDPKAKIVDLQGPAGIVDDNVLSAE